MYSIFAFHGDNITAVVDHDQSAVRMARLRTLCRFSGGGLACIGPAVFLTSLNGNALALWQDLWPFVTLFALLGAAIAFRQSRLAAWGVAAAIFALMLTPLLVYPAVTPIRPHLALMIVFGPFNAYAIICTWRFQQERKLVELFA